MNFLPRPFLALTALALALGGGSLALDPSSANAQRRIQLRNQGRHWEVLGQQDVSFRQDHDVIPVGRRDGRFESIRLQVLRNDIRLDEIQVVFGNGRAMRVPTRGLLLREGQQTSAIDLPGDDRIIRQVVLHYSTIGRRYEGRAVVRVLGLEDPTRVRRRPARRRAPLRTPRRHRSNRY